MYDAEYELEKDRNDENRFIITSHVFCFSKRSITSGTGKPVLVDTRNNEEEPRPFGAAAAKPDAI